MSRTALPMTCIRRQRGVGLIEVLITVLVLAVGLLGLSALQISSLKNNQSAMQRSLAVVQSYTIVEAIRADTESAKQGRFNITLDGTPGEGTFPAGVHTLWRAQLKQNLGESATGAVSCSNIKCAITVQWDDSRGSQGSEIQQIVTEVLL
ncbi:type IV pilus modification protein PilV [Denitrificimonas caeni]|uniref:type IV pilus modification protein PilV n=1 Tax=Denitrificimonas caeni TaxID=521720 RepID=UPI0019653FDF|nr:type IV pilus modification protein PilV [Denitrificimonas caeni]